MTEWLIQRVLRLVGGITAGQWDAALELVQQAARHLKSAPGAERKAYVVENLKRAFTAVPWKEWMLDVLVGLAYGFAKRKGWVK